MTQMHARGQRSAFGFAPWWGTQRSGEPLYATFSRGLGGRSPTVPAYRHHGFGAAEPAYTDYEGEGGWRYRLHNDPDRSIEILAAPAGHERAVQTVLNAKSGGKAYSAILGEIESKGKKKKIRISPEIASLVIKTGTDVTLTALGSGKKKRRKKAKVAAEEPAPVVESSSSLPSWLPWAAGATAIVLAGVFAFGSARGGAQVTTTADVAKAAA